MVGPVWKTTIWLVTNDIHEPITYLGPSPLYPACSPLFPFSYWFSLSTCCTVYSVICTPHMFGSVCWSRTGCSCHMPHMADGGDGTHHLLVKVVHPPFQYHCCCHSLQPGKSAGCTNSLVQREGLSTWNLTLHCITDIHMLGACTSGQFFAFSFALPDAIAPPSNLVSLNNMDRAIQHSSSTHCASSAHLCSSSSCHAGAASFHQVHVGCTSSILVTKWPVTCGALVF